MRYLLLILYFIVVNSALACSCAKIDTTEAALVEKELKYSDYITKGVVIKKDTAYYTSFEGGERVTDSKIGYARYLVTLKISSYFVSKGELTSDTILIETPISSAACGYYFLLGYEYIVYGRATKTDTSENKWIKIKTDMCTRTTLNVDHEVNLLRLFKEEKFIKP